MRATAAAWRLGHAKEDGGGGEGKGVRVWLPPVRLNSTHDVAAGMSVAPESAVGDGDAGDGGKGGGGAAGGEGESGGEGGEGFDAGEFGCRVRYIVLPSGVLSVESDVSMPEHWPTVPRCVVCVCGLGREGRRRVLSWCLKRCVFREGVSTVEDAVLAFPCCALRRTPAPFAPRVALLCCWLRLLESKRWFDWNNVVSPQSFLPAPTLVDNSRTPTAIDFLHREARSQRDPNLLFLIAAVPFATTDHSPCNCALGPFCPFLRLLLFVGAHKQCTQGGPSRPPAGWLLLDPVVWPRATRELL